MTAEQWVELFAKEIGANPPSKEEVEEILARAAEAPHSSERIAAPIACWLGGRAGKPLKTKGLKSLVDHGPQNCRKLRNERTVAPSLVGNRPR